MLLKYPLKLFAEAVTAKYSTVHRSIIHFNNWSDSPAILPWYNHTGWMGEKSQLTYLLIYLLTYLLTPYSCILYGYCFKESINAIQYKAPTFVTVYFYPTNKHKTLHNPTEVFPYKRRRGRTERAWVFWTVMYSSQPNEHRARTA